MDARVGDLDVVEALLGTRHLGGRVLQAVRICLRTIHTQTEPGQLDGDLSARTSIRAAASGRECDPPGARRERARPT